MWPQDRELIYFVSKHICHFSPALATNDELQNKRKTHKQDFKLVVSISGKSEMLISLANDMLVVFVMSEWSFPFIQKQTENVRFLDSDRPQSKNWPRSNQEASYMKMYHWIFSIHHSWEPDRSWKRTTHPNEAAGNLKEASQEIWERSMNIWAMLMSAFTTFGHHKTQLVLRCSLFF